jgi:hypothetical protein
MTKHGAILFHLVYITRRIVLILNALYVNSMPSLQMMVFLILSASYAVFLVLEQPFYHLAFNQIEIINELQVLLLSSFATILIATNDPESRL